MVLERVEKTDELRSRRGEGRCSLEHQGEIDLTRA